MRGLRRVTIHFSVYTWIYCCGNSRISRDCLFSGSGGEIAVCTQFDLTTECMYSMAQRDEMPFYADNNNNKIQIAIPKCMQICTRTYS